MCVFAFVFFVVGFWGKDGSNSVVTVTNDELEAFPRLRVLRHIVMNSIEVSIIIYIDPMLNRSKYRGSKFKSEG